jgi:hypothetical protein
LPIPREADARQADLIDAGQHVPELATRRVGIEKIRDALGHTTVRMSELYPKLKSTRLKECLQRSTSVTSLSAVTPGVTFKHKNQGSS